MGEITKKVQESRLKWYGHVMRREEHYVGRRAMVTKVQGRRKRGRPTRRWLDKVKDAIKEKGLSADDVYDRATWRRMTSYTDMPPGTDCPYQIRMLAFFEMIRPYHVVIRI